MGYWPWWLGSLALTAIVVGYWVAGRGFLGVSSSLTRVVTARAEILASRQVKVVADAAALRQALIEATLAQFGPEAVAAVQAQSASKVVAEEEAEKAEAVAAAAPRKRAPWPLHLTFLIALLVGGLLAAAADGSLSIRWHVGPTFGELIGTGTTSVLVLVGGGLLVGFGARMQGGCTYGHGLTGCSRLEPGSIVATGIFFTVGVIVHAFLGGAT